MNTKKFENYKANLAVLTKANGEDLQNEFIISGIVDKFFIQFELGWKVLKELMNYEGISAVKTGSPRDIIKAAYTVYDFMDETIWLDMLRARNDMTHIYNGEAAKQLVQDIINRYIPEFIRLMEGIRQLYEI